jgi:hypothetical protein
MSGKIRQSSPICKRESFRFSGVSTCDIWGCRLLVHATTNTMELSEGQIPLKAFLSHIPPLWTFPLVPLPTYHPFLSIQADAVLYRYRYINMQVNDSEHLPGTHEGGVRRRRGLPIVNNNATVHELNQIKTEALRNIDAGCFSCAATCPRLLPVLLTGMS